MEFSCVDCMKKPCRTHDLDQLPKGCPTASCNPEKVFSLYSEEERKMLREAAAVERIGYGRHTRVEEIMHFCHRMGYQKVGIAFCSGFSSEANTLAKVLRDNGFEVVGVCCKVCSISKRKLGIRDEEQVRPGQFEAMCNPGYQAVYLNEAGVDIKILLGLCVGHDTEFLIHAKPPVTVLATKDRALGHNPLAALYGVNSYFKRLTTFIERLKKDGRA